MTETPERDCKLYWETAVSPEVLYNRKAVSSYRDKKAFYKSNWRMNDYCNKPLSRFSIWQVITPLEFLYPEYPTQRYFPFLKLA